ncbi:PREDICTED: histone-lysine N-methyltransferase SETMAR-like [Dufourea novaeangliae]|uniref:histone-lysine N-methyltransferase SETMAR-like n=1 Tax=Dufourea novaeangliae TaxID=178035 RepID=UPI000767929B|nr:PREDICTED: histone-lysine N-methyltransferase SETMAR-like [Dufourea novaeangliae]
MDVKNVSEWCREFAAGRTEVHDEERSGRPSISNEIAAKVEQTMREDRRITLDDLCILVPEISRSTIHRILTEKLQYRKVCARWVPRMLTEDHQRQRVESSREFVRRYADEKDNVLDSIVTGDETWAFHYIPATKQQLRQWRRSSSPKPRKFKQSPSAGKVMVTVFWDEKGVLLVDFMPSGTTINADRYCETLKKLRRAIQNRRRGMLSKGVSILYDNARPHVACTTVALLQQFGWEMITHPPYSPDLAPSDYHLFPKLKEHLTGTRFSNDDEVKDEVQRFLNGMAASWYDMGIQKLLQRLQKCIDRNGDYVEK